MNTKKFNIVDYVITHFVSADSLRESMQIAHNQNGYVYASEGHIVIKVPEALCAKEYVKDKPGDNGAVDYGKVISEPERTFVSELSIAEVLPCIENIRVQLAKSCKECKECSGEGEIECEYCGHSAECKNCDGKGSIEQPNKIMVRDVSFTKDGEILRYIEINGRRFNPVFMELIMFSMLALGFDICSYYRLGQSSGLFIIGNIEIMVMEMAY